MSRQPPKIYTPVKINGKTIGDITINPDGTFEGKLTDRLTHTLWASYLEFGFGDSVTIHPNLTPAVEAESRSQTDG